MHLQHELLLIYGSGDWMNIRAIETVRVWHTFGGTLLCEHGPCCSLEDIKNWQGLVLCESAWDSFDLREYDNATFSWGPWIWWTWEK